MGLDPPRMFFRSTLPKIVQLYVCVLLKAVDISIDQLDASGTVIDSHACAVHDVIFMHPLSIFHFGFSIRNMMGKLLSPIADDSREPSQRHESQPRPQLPGCGPMQFRDGGKKPSA